LTIGYGAGGMDAISFRLSRKNQDLDVGHLKFFFMTKSADIQHIRQESPFTDIRAIAPFQWEVYDTWVAFQYPIIQHRA